MSQYRPGVSDLLATVKTFIDAVAPQLAGETRYHAQVCSFLLSVCERELAAADAHEGQESAAWRDLLGAAEGDLGTLTSTLCSNIRSGLLDDRFDEVLDVILARTTCDAELVRPDQVTPHKHAADS